MFRPKHLIVGATLFLSLLASGGRADDVIKAGLAVHLPATDGQIEIDLAGGGGMLVHGLAIDADSLKQSRKAIRRKGLYGLASVQHATSLSTLPYADGLVNLLVADLDKLGAKAPAKSEINRVLAPLGVARVRKGGKWKIIRKARPEGMDDWTHYDHGPGGNPVSSDTLVEPVTALRWYASPTISRAGSEKEAGLRIAGGRIIYAVKDYGIKYRLSRKTSKNHLICRDAYNGLLLWRIPLPKDNYTPYRHEFIADGRRVYGMIEATGSMAALDAATGKVVVTYDQGARVEPMEIRDRRAVRQKRHMVARLCEGKLIQAYHSTVYVLDANTGKKAWTYSEGPGKFISLAVAGEGKVFAVVGSEETISMRGTVAIKVGSIVAMDIKSGKLLWRNREYAGNYMTRLVYADGNLPIAYFPGGDRKGRQGKAPMTGFGHKFGVANVRASDGKTVWNEPKAQSVGGHYAITFVRDGKAYVACERYIGYDLKTGRFDRGIAQRTFVNACAETRATPKYVLYGMSFGDLSGKFSPRAIVRSTCDTGVFPANGLVYCSPPLCCCLDVLAGYTATAPEAPPRPTPASQRLVTGEATVQSADGAKPWPGPGDWPMHMANPKRGCWTPTSVAKDLKVAWKVKLADWPDGRIVEDWKESESPAWLVTAPVVAGGRVFAAAPNQHRLAVMDAASGKVIWSFTAGGRIDSPPTIYRGLCLMGCRDGWVYALRATDGKLVWKFLAGVTPKRIIDNGHLESPWPVAGSVMIHNGKLLCLAGRHSAVDGGIQLYQLDPMTGKMIWRSRIWSASLDATPGKEVPVYSIHGKTGKYYPRSAHLLVSDGKRVHHFIETLKDSYKPGELVDLHPSNGRWDRVNPKKMTWLKSNMAGFISRRGESVGRFDYDGVRYSDVNASAIVIADKAIYCVKGKQSGTRDKFGHLTRVAIDGEGNVAEKSGWKARIRHQDDKRTHSSFKVSAMIVAGDRLFLAGHVNEKPQSAVHSYAASDGKKLGQWALPARPVRNGLAAADGRLLVTCEDGSITCLK
jgi:outer membrane protein assembly factor BamB